MNTFTLKIIALTSMIIDHIGSVFSMHINFRIIGRLAFPLYVYLLAEGFFYTKNKLKFLGRLLVFAVVSEPFYDMAFSNAASLTQVNFFANTNIFYTFFLGGLAITMWEEVRAYFERGVLFDMILAVLAVVPMAYFANVLGTDYSAYGVVFVFIMYFVRVVRAGDFLQELKEPAQKLWPVVMVALCAHQFFDRVIVNAIRHGIGSLPASEWGFQVAVIVPAVLVLFYNGKRGPSFKWAFYIAYPAHIAALVGISVLLGN